MKRQKSILCKRTGKIYFEALVYYGYEEQEKDLVRYKTKLFLLIFIYR